MTGISLLANAVERAERAEARAARAEQALERSLALAVSWDHHQSVHVREMAASLRTVVAEPTKEVQR